MEIFDRIGLMVDLLHLPKKNQGELELIKKIIIEDSKAEMVILFGSYARGDWVSDRYKEGHITYEYLSDYDILVIVKSEKLEKNFGLWNEIERKIKDDSEIENPVSLVVDTIHFVNKRLSEGNYFYSDIKKEGVVLYDSGEFKLSEPKSLSGNEQKFLQKRDFDFWFQKAQSFKKDYLHNLEDGEYNNAAFHLHQIAEVLYVAVLLVATGYKPKTHNLEKIENMVLESIPELRNVFPKETQEQKRMFDLLKSSYTDARYRQDFGVTRNELDYLFSCVQKLEDLVYTLCTRIMS